MTPLENTDSFIRNSAADQPARIFIDHSYTIGSGKSSGIERVVKSVMRECLEMSTAAQLPSVEPVISIDGGFYRLEQAQVDEFARAASLHRNVLEQASPQYRRVAENVCQFIPLEKLHKWLLPQPGHLGLFKLKHSYDEYQIRRRALRSCERVLPRSGDLFLLPDAYWVKRLSSTIWPAAQEARNSGAKIATLLYDLIPLTHPQFVGQERSTTFLSYLKRVANHSDLIVAISKTVRDEAKQFLRSVETPFDAFCDDIRAFKLGAELQLACGSVREEVTRVFDNERPPYLMVATFDPRKNHDLLLDAFDRLWDQDQNVNLCLVGRFGNKCTETIRRVHSHPKFGSRLRLFNDLTDAELHYCYRKARGVVFTSVVEGFGLPIVESLWHGQKTFASDTPIHREVGGEDCTYFGLSSPDSLVEVLLDWEKQALAGAKPSVTRKPTTWRDSTAELVAHCRSLFGRAESQDRAA